MFCTNCGNEIISHEKFCTNCGLKVMSANKSSIASEFKDVSILKIENGKWYHRLVVVIYVVAHLPLLFIIPAVWSANARYYSTYSKKFYGSDAEAFGYSILTIIIWLIVLRLIKMATKYVVLGKKPNIKDLVFF